MKSLSSVLLVAIITNTSASETEIRKLELENGFILLIAETIHSRNMPWAFYDQAIKSLPKIHPNTTIVAEERLGKTGKNNEVLYSLIGYKVPGKSDEVAISGIATNIDRAWSFSIVVAETTLAHSLNLVLQQLSQLPYNMQPDFGELALSSAVDASRYVANLVSQQLDNKTWRK